MFLKKFLNRKSAGAGQEGRNGEQKRAQAVVGGALLLTGCTITIYVHLTVLACGHCLPVTTLLLSEPALLKKQQ